MKQLFLAFAMAAGFVGAANAQTWTDLTKTQYFSIRQARITSGSTLVSDTFVSTRSTTTAIYASSTVPVSASIIWGYRDGQIVSTSVVAIDGTGRIVDRATGPLIAQNVRISPSTPISLTHSIEARVIQSQ